MDIILIFFLELFLLFLLSRLVQKNLSQFLFLITGSIKWTIAILSLLFLPGTILHELAHFFFAAVLLVPVGKMEFIPKLHGESVKLGSVSIGQTDPFRRILIGIAPFLIGTLVILFTLYLSEKNILWKNSWAVAGVFYILFEVGNTMFSSKKDLEGASLILVLVALLTTLFYILGIHIDIQDINRALNDQTIHLFYQGVIYLLFPIGLDLLLLIALKISLRTLNRS